MEWRFFLKMLMLPPGSLILALLLAWTLRRRLPRLAGLLFLGGLLVFWLMSTPRFLEWAAAQYEIDPPLPPSAWSRLTEHADAIVVLGAGRRQADPGWGADVAGIHSTERVRYASRIAKASGLPVLTSGGKVWEGADHPSEADLMADILERDLGVPVRWREGRSRSTQENAEQSRVLLQREGLHRVVLVTQAWHMPRARHLFLGQGFQVIAAPMTFMSQTQNRPFGGLIPDAGTFADSVQLAHEWLGTLLYTRVPGLASSH